MRYNSQHHAVDPCCKYRYVVLLRCMNKLSSVVKYLHISPENLPYIRWQPFVLSIDDNLKKKCFSHKLVPSHSRS